MIGQILLLLAELLGFSIVFDRPLAEFFKNVKDFD